MKIGIVGAGHAGVAAALAVVKNGGKATIFSNENSLPYFRPRIPGIAFGQVTKDEALMHPLEWYTEQNIELIINKTVVEVSDDKKITVSDGEQYSFDKIIVTAGAIPIVPPFAKKCGGDSVIPLWNIEQAELIKSKLSEISKIVIIGGGVIGIEAALRAADAGLEVSIVELKQNLMERILMPKSSALLAELLKSKGIKLYTGQAVETIDDSDGKIIVSTDKTKNIETDLVILSIGNAFDLSFMKQCSVKADRAVLVDNLMHTSDINFYAAGDIAQLPDIINVCSALKATMQGKVAGNNSVSPDDHIIGYNHEQISVQLKYKDFQLYSIGKSECSGSCSEMVLEDKPNEVYRTLIMDGESVVGIQMIGDLTDFKKYEKQLV